ncbi:unnamed protein product [Moneuplotes crassus]|uniref:Uncharacterized protein n=1 Tax=Euplotes crassus TaxID=5936 RepID=A0AAD1U6A6_EUPCR|nr:unnamed protein product [Moneuplotes crassus]
MQDKLTIDLKPTHARRRSFLGSVSTALCTSKHKGYKSILGVSVTPVRQRNKAYKDSLTKGTGKSFGSYMKKTLKIPKIPHISGKRASIRNSSLKDDILVMMRGKFTMKESKRVKASLKIRKLQQYNKDEISKEVLRTKLRLMSINPICATHLKDYQEKNQSLFDLRKYAVKIKLTILAKAYDVYNSLIPQKPGFLHKSCIFKRGLKYLNEDLETQLRMVRGLLNHHQSLNYYSKHVSKNLKSKIFGNRDSSKTRNTTPFYIFKKAPATRDIYNKVASSQGRKRFKDFLHHSKIQICKANSDRKTNALRLREIHKPFQTRIECLNTSSKCKALRFKRKVPLCDLVRPF